MAVLGLDRGGICVLSLPPLNFDTPACLVSPPFKISAKSDHFLPPPLPPPWSIPPSPVTGIVAESSSPWSPHCCSVSYRSLHPAARQTLLKQSHTLSFLCSPSCQVRPQMIGSPLSLRAHLTLLPLLMWPQPPRPPHSSSTPQECQGL